MLTRQQLLEACNLISVKYGGSRVGTVKGYRNQYLISVELHDSRALNAVGVVLGLPPEPVYHWIRLGFCQTNITRAPRGGFTLEIGPEILARCWTPEDVLAYFETWIGTAKERERKLRAWEERIGRRGVNQDGRLSKAVFQVQQVLEGLPFGHQGLFAEVSHV